MEKIRVRWEDDGTLSGWIKVSELDAPEDIGVTQKAFVAACHKNPYRTAKWFEKLRLPLKEGHGCLEDLCVCLG